LLARRIGGFIEVPDTAATPIAAECFMLLAASTLISALPFCHGPLFAFGH